MIIILEEYAHLIEEVQQLRKFNKRKQGSCGVSAREDNAQEEKRSHKIVIVVKKNTELYAIITNYYNCKYVSP